MQPLDIVITFAEFLKDSEYTSLANICVLIVFITASIKVTLFLFGKNERAFFTRLYHAAINAYINRRGYSPEFEKFRVKVEPYISFWSDLFYAFVGFITGLLVGFTAVLASAKAPFWVLMGAVVFSMACFAYMRFNLEAASWAWHRIKHKGG